MKLKKVMALVMTGTLAASALTACSSGKDNGSTTQAEANGGTEKESSAEQGAEKTVITFGLRIVTMQRMFRQRLTSITKPIRIISKLFTRCIQITINRP